MRSERTSDFLNQTKRLMEASDVDAWIRKLFYIKQILAKKILEQKILIKQAAVSCKHESHLEN